MFLNVCLDHFWMPSQIKADKSKRMYPSVFLGARTVNWHTYTQKITDKYADEKGLVHHSPSGPLLSSPDTRRSVSLFTTGRHTHPRPLNSSAGCL